MPINPLAPTLKVVRCNARYCDPALDLDAMDLDKYRTSRDPESVKAKSGETPTWFVLRRLKAAMQLEVLDGLGLNERISYALRVGLVRIESPTEGPITPTSTTPSPQYGVEIAGHDWLQTVLDRYGKETLIEMGRCVLELSALGEGARGPLFSSGT